MKIAVITNSSAPYRDRLYECVASHLHQDGGGMDLLEGSQPKAHQWNDERKSAAGINFVRLDGARLPAWLARLLRLSSAQSGEINISFYRTFNILRCSNPEIVWIHELSPMCLVGAVYATLYRKKLVLSSELGRSNYRSFRKLTQLLQKVVGTILDGVIANSPAAKEPISPRPIPVVDAPHAVDFEEYRREIEKPNCGTPKLIFVGNLIYRKGIDVLVEALGSLTERDPDLQFLLQLVGGSETEWIKETSAYQRIESKIEFTGFKQGKDLIEVYQKADIFVLPSRYDTYGVVGHEAACAGLPLVISSGAGVSKSLVVDGQSGFVFENENSEQLSEILERMICDPRLREKCSEGATKKGKEYCVTRTAAKIHAFFAELVS